MAQNPELNMADSAVEKIKEGVELMLDIARVNMKDDDNHPERYPKVKRRLENAEHDLLNGASSVISHIMLADRAKERGA